MCVYAGGVGGGLIWTLVSYFSIFPLESILFVIIVYFHILVVGTKQIYKDGNIPVVYGLLKT